MQDRDVYYRRHRAEWLAKIREAGVRRRAERLYQQLDVLQHLRQQARRDLLAEGRKHAITAKLRQIPYWADSRGAADCADADSASFSHQATTLGLQRIGLGNPYQRGLPLCEGQLRRSKKVVSIRGLNKDHNHDLKGLFKGAATMASVAPDRSRILPGSLAKGMKPTMARLTLARKIAAITLTLWKKGESFDAEKLKSQAA